MAASPTAADPGLLARVPMFAPLSDSERAQLLSVARPVVFAKGEAIVRQGQPGHSLFVMHRGDASVTLAGTEGEVARWAPETFSAKCPWLTGEARTATVVAATDCDLVEIDAEGFRSVVLPNPSVLEHVTTVAAARREELNLHRESHATAPSPAETRHSLLNRVRQFLRL